MDRPRLVHRGFLGAYSKYTIYVRELHTRTAFSVPFDDNEVVQVHYFVGWMAGTRAQEVQVSIQIFPPLI